MNSLGLHEGLSSEPAARRLVELAKARPTDGLDEADRWLESDDPADAVAARWARGAALYELGRNDEALIEFERAIAEGPDLLNDWVGISLAAAESAAGRQDDAVARLSELSEAEHPVVALLATSQLGMIRLHQGRTRDSLALLEESAAGLRAHPDERVALARVLGNAGYCGLLLGEILAAEQHFNEAMKLATETDQMLMAAGLGQNLAYVRMCLGDLPTAIAAYRRAVEVYRDIGVPRRNLVALYDDLAEAYRFANLTRDAVRYARLSVWTARQSTNVEVRADSLYRYAQCLVDHGSHAPAIGAANEAADLFARSGRDLWAVRSELIATTAVIGANESEAGPLADAELLASIAGRLDELGSPAEATTARNLAAQLLISHGYSDAARDVLTRPGSEDASRRRTEHTVENFERLFSRALLARLDGQPLQPVLDEARSSLTDLLRGLADAELRNGVAKLSTRFRSLALDQVLTEPVDPLVIVETEELWRFIQTPISGRVDNQQEDDEISEHLGKLRLLYRERRRQDGLNEDVESQIVDLEKEVRELSMAKSAAESTGGGHLDVGASDSSPTASFMAWLEATDGRLVQVFEHRGEIHAVSISGASATHRVAGPRSRLDEQLASIRTSMGRLLRSQRSSPTSEILWSAVQADGRELGRSLLGQTSPGQPIVVSCPPGFAPLPWSLMVDESSPVSVISSSSTWRADPPRIATRRVAAVIGPELEHAFDDGSALAEALPSATTIGEAEASSENLIDVLQRNSIVHVAAHSHFRPDSVMFSSLRLADGLVPVYEFTRLASCPQLVVLAACEAGGTGGSGFGEWLGLVPELLRAGAECLVAPIRPIADVDASLVMRHFYRHLPDASVAGALARTRLDLLDQAPRVQAAGHAFLAFGRGHAVLG